MSCQLHFSILTVHQIFNPETYVCWLPFIKSINVPTTKYVFTITEGAQFTNDMNGVNELSESNWIADLNMQWAICLVESQLKSMVLSAIEMQYTPHHSGTKHSYSDALSLLVTRCMKSSNSKMYTSARSELTMGKHACYGPPVLITAVVHRCQWVMALHGTVSGTAVTYRCQGVLALHGTVSGTAVVHRR